MVIFSIYYSIGIEGLSATILGINPHAGDRSAKFLMQLSESVPSEVIQQVSEYFSVLGEPMRLRILNLLKDGEKCVQDLVESTSTSQANVSKHLKVMLQAGILTRRSEGTSAYYSVADDLTYDLCHLVCDRLATRIEQQARHFRAFSLTGR
jgi:DNA-binding transcriptional ArsR family regulator